MKKLICLILCLCLATTGCSQAPAEENIPETQPVQTEAPTSTTVEETEAAIVETIPAMAYQNPFTAVSLVPHQETVQADNGTTLYRISSPNMTLVMNDHSVADAIVHDFTGRSSKRLAAAEKDLAAASEDYAGQSDWTAYFCDMIYDTGRIDQMTLSLIGTETFFDGTHRSGQAAVSLTYDMQTGVFLTLKDVLTADFSADALVQCILDALADQANDLFEDYADSISALFATNTPAENWYFSETGLRFYFNPYEIAPQNKGIVLAEIPYEQLIGILKDAYFPAEAVEFSGKLMMSAFTDADTSAITQFAEAVLDSNGSQYLIYPQGTVLNIRVEMGTWTKSGAFVADAAIFTAEALTTGNALMLQLNEEDLGALCITYQTGHEIIQIPWQTN